MKLFLKLKLCLDKCFVLMNGTVQRGKHTSHKFYKMYMMIYRSSWPHEQQTYSKSQWTEKRIKYQLFSI